MYGAPRELPDSTSPPTLEASEGVDSFCSGIQLHLPFLFLKRSLAPQVRIINISPYRKIQSTPYFSKCNWIRPVSPRKTLIAWPIVLFRHIVLVVVCSKKVVRTKDFKRLVCGGLVGITSSSPGEPHRAYIYPLHLRERSTQNLDSS